ncbi:MAG: DNA-binding protein WhiA [Bacteroides sp.]|nr:DNA-binding protein WhiA [Bacillota bacterium]MCM1394132.1 DNA-binding protein WhiA [[Eubacterium] siraeum]MCM1456054.1 DNA-binding protein WhiA [Bacteroides sp.]
MSATFKEDAKRELLSVLPTDECCIKSFLSALTKANGAIEGTGRKQVICISLDALDAAEQTAKLLKKLYPTDFGISEHKHRVAGADRRVYKIVIPHGYAEQALDDFELMRVDGDGLLNFTRGLPQQLLRKECCLRAYFKGLFLACGSVYAPDNSGSESKKGYHFELKFADEEFANSAVELLTDLRINPRMSDRAGNKLLYVKDKDEIVRILCILELGDSATKMQNIINERETANVLNRSIICETANMDKTFSASSRQVLAIARIRDRGEYEKLSAALKETADARATYSEASMQELADILGVTKSCLHHRLSKLESIASALE